MIFSLSTNSISASPILPESEFHSYLFFSHSASIDLSSKTEEILPSIFASLRMKKGILLIDSFVSSEEKFLFNRGLRSYEGSSFIYLAPHSLSLLRPSLGQTISSYPQFRVLLIASKLLK